MVTPIKSLCSGAPRRLSRDPHGVDYKGQFLTIQALIFHTLNANAGADVR